MKYRCFSIGDCIKSTFSDRDYNILSNKRNVTSLKPRISHLYKIAHKGVIYHWKACSISYQMNGRIIPFLHLEDMLWRFKEHYPQNQNSQNQPSRKIANIQL